MPLPLIPVRDSPAVEQPEAAYADPADCVPASVRLQSGKAQYVDPASVLPLQPPGRSEALACGRADSVYSEVYDRVSPVQIQQPTLSPAGGQEPIYSEPTSTVEGREKHREENKPDPFAHLYAQVCKTKRGKPEVGVAPADDNSPRPVAACSDTSTRAIPKTIIDQDDVIYENLGMI